MPLRPGDALVVLADHGFEDRWQGARDFAVVAPLDAPEPPGRDPYRWLAIGTLVGMVALAASASFLPPIGYQTNTIVYGLGGYRFGDYWRLGLPLTGAVVVTALVVIPLVWG